MIAFVKEIKPDVVVFVDNCYGEFIEEQEPCHVGADLMAGSLIKTRGELLKLVVILLVKNSMLKRVPIV